MASSWCPWFSSPPLNNRPSHHANDSTTAFKNPWPSAEAPTLAELLQAKFPLGVYEDLAKKHPGTKDVSVVVPDWGASDLEKSGPERERSIVGTTLGHAGVITEFPLVGTGNWEGEKSFWVVYDPIFSLRAGPIRYTGPKRLRPPPCQVTDLLGCDSVMISHNHYDHLDLSTIEAIFKKFPKARYFIPLGNKGWICSLGIPQDRVHELDWWQNREYSVRDFRYTIPQDTSEDTLLRFTCVPAQHNSGRGAFDQSITLWCGWRGGSLGFISYLGLRLSHDNIPSALHSTPADAINIHNDVLSRNTVVVHFGTFVGSENESLEAVIEFTKRRESQDVLSLDKPAAEGRSRAGILNIGGSIIVEINIHEVIQN
ncbi:Metallo-hydrolase/oxidoreductase [Hyaloscypha finlandica]|nr:Metallo-hydrolase/oxidoreductase [Hyaloscypha finlandica]